MSVERPLAMFCGDFMSSADPIVILPGGGWTAGDVLEKTDGGVVVDDWNKFAMGVIDESLWDMNAGTDPGVAMDAPADGSMERICCSWPR